MTFDEQNLEKKFLALNNSQDSIQTLSLWILHHKNHYKKIIQIWLKMLEKDKSSYRLTLFYLANDVIQHAKKKKLRQYLDGFQDVLKRATVFVKNEKIVSKVLRVFSIWLERNIYPPEFINELKEILQSTQSNTQNEPTMKIVSEFKLTDLENKLKKLQKATTLTQNSIKNINITKIDSLSNEVLIQLKDKSNGEQFCKEFDEIEKVLQNAIVSIENEVSARASFLILLEKAEIYYETQKSEVKIVANAYKNFSIRVKTVKNKLLDSTYPSPQPSPSIDAPSPSMSNDSLILPGSNSPLPGLKTLLDVLSKKSSKKNKVSSLDKRLSNLMQNIPSPITQENNKVHNESNLHSSINLLDSFNDKSNLNVNTNSKIDQTWSVSNNNDYNDYQQQHIFAYQNLMHKLPENNFYSEYPPPPPPPPIEDYNQNKNNLISYQDNNFNEKDSFNNNSCVQQIKSVISTRNDDELSLNNKSNINFDPFINHSNFNLLSHHSTHENFEPSDMDLDNSDEEDNVNRSQNSQRVLKVIETSNNTTDNFSNKQVKSQIHPTTQPNFHHNLTSLSQTIPSLLSFQTSNNNYHGSKQKQFYSSGKSFHHDTSNLNKHQSKNHLQSIAVASTSHNTSSLFGSGPNRLLGQHPHNIHNNTNNNNNITRSWKNNQVRLNNNNLRNRGSFSNYHY